MPISEIVVNGFQITNLHRDAVYYSHNSTHRAYCIIIAMPKSQHEIKPEKKTVEVDR